MFCVFCAVSFGAAKAHDIPDYPTATRVDYVFACMATQGNNYDALRRCSCSIDVIAENLSYDDYVNAETVLRMRQGLGGERFSMFRGSPWADKIVAKLARAQVEADLHCFSAR